MGDACAGDNGASSSRGPPGLFNFETGHSDLHFLKDFRRTLFQFCAGHELYSSSLNVFEHTNVHDLATNLQAVD